MNVFILCTGRSGSTTFMKACKHITNFTSAHESRSRLLGEERFNYPENHIEGDNRLSWMLGELDKQFGDEAFYVHLIRDKSKVVESFQRRWKPKGSIIRAFGEAIKLQKIKELTEEEKRTLSSDYYETVNENIRFFLRDKPGKMTVRFEEVKDRFPEFWDRINAEGDQDAALNEFDVKYNASGKGGILGKWFTLF